MLPSATDLEAVASDPALLTPLTRGYLEDARFEDRLVRLLAQRWWTRIDDFESTYYDYDLPDEDHYRFLRSVGEEPLRLLARVVADDRPWTDAVTVDWTVADELLAEMWSLDYPDGASGWQPSRYADGRPAAGVLTTNGLWWRYISNQPNLNRARAAAVSDLLLCEDILGRPVSFSSSSALDSETGIREDPYCVGCHAHIEPVAATLFGFFWLKDISALEMQVYHPERERLGPDLLGVEPSWFGTPIRGLVDLGWAVANDPRYTSCAVQQFAELLWMRDTTLGDFDELAALEAGFEDAGLEVKPLLEELTRTRSYTAGAQPDGEGEVVLRMMGADLLESVLADLAGFTWERDGYGQLDNDLEGYRLMAGGVDGEQVFRAALDPSLTWALVVQRAAEGAARSAVDADGVFGGVELAGGPGDAAFEEDLRALHWRLYAERADDAFVDDASQLFAAVEELDGADEAWVALVSAMLRDPHFLGY